MAKVAASIHRSLRAGRSCAAMFVVASLATMYLASSMLDILMRPRWPWQQLATATCHIVDASQVRHSQARCMSSAVASDVARDWEVVDPIARMTVVVASEAPATHGSGSVDFADVEGSARADTAAAAGSVVARRRPWRRSRDGRSGGV